MDELQRFMWWCLENYIANISRVELIIIQASLFNLEKTMY